MFKAICTKDNGTATYAMSGRLDTGTSTAFGEELQSAFDDKLNIILDGAELEYISSAGLRVLLSAFKTTREYSGEYRVINLRPEVREVMYMVGFTDIMDIE